MSLAQITLTTNKTVSNVGDYIRKIGQGERGQILPVVVTDANGAVYDLTNKSIVFSENKDSGKYVVDDGKASTSGKFTLTDPQNGKFSYTLQEQVYPESGTAWFDIVSADGTVLDTTVSFRFVVIPAPTLHVNDDNYSSTLEALQAHYQGVIKNTETQTQNLINSLTDKIDQAISNGQRDIANELSDARTKLQAIQDQENELVSNWTTELNTQKQNFATLQSQWQEQSKSISDDYASKKEKIESDAQSQHNSIQDAADQQLKNNQTANDAEINSVKQQLSDELAKVETDKVTAIQGITNARDKAIQDATDKLTAKLQSVQADYDSWKTFTVSDFQAKLDKLTKELATDESSQTALKQAIDSAKDTISKIKDVDFTVYVHKDDLKNYYTKAELDPMIEQAGKVKTVNGIQPDSSGNIAIPAPDLSGLETTADAKTANDALDKKISDNTVAIRENSDAIATKANASDVYTKAELDPKLAEAGKVKTVNNITPDSTGNVNIPAPDLSNLETKTDAKTALDAKADKSDVTTLQATITGLSTKVDSVVTKLSDGTLAKVAHFKASEEQKAVDWSKDDGKGGLPKIGIIDG